MLGQFPTKNDDRDAVHIAIVPMIAGEDLCRGDVVWKVDNKVYSAHVDATHCIGIIDPFLMYVGTIRKDSLVWVCLFPNQVTGMRHHWVHPAFTTKDESEQWLRNFCDSSGCPEFEILMGILNEDDFEDKDFQEYIGDDYWHFSGIDAGGTIPPEFWTHAENYLSKTFTFYERPTKFSCSC